MKIKEWIRDGNKGDIAELCGTTDQLLQFAGRVLDHEYSHEMLGEVLFVGEDGKTYVGTVEFCINEANPDYVEMVLEEEENEKTR